MAGYLAEKKRVADLVIESLEKRFPGLKEQVEATDVATSVTSERYTGAFHGFQTWPSKAGQQDILKNGLSKTHPDPNNFYMAEQWSVAKVDLNTAAPVSCNLVSDLCKEDGKSLQPLG